MNLGSRIEKSAGRSSNPRKWLSWRKSNSGHVNKQNVEKEGANYEALAASGRYDAMTLQFAYARLQPALTCDSRISEGRERAPKDAEVNQKGYGAARSPPNGQDSPHSSSDEGSMNKKARDLSIDDGRRTQRTYSNPNEKKRSGQDSQSQQGSKRTRHYNDLPNRDTNHKYESTQSHDEAQKESQSLNSAKAPEPHSPSRPAKPRPSSGRTTSPADQGGGDVDGAEVTMLLQPETRPITQEQLVNEVKGIYAGLVMVEKKCVEICTQQASSNSKHLSNEQWQALIALHRTLLHEHHDFFLASQHPTASPALRRLATKYAMPAR